MKIKFIYSFALIALLINMKTMAQNPLWVRDNTWYFDNFDQPELPWDIFRETFIGVAPSPSGDFDLLFYNLLYKTELAKKGHCYGMDVLALMLLKNGGHLGYCHPPYVYTAESPNPADTLVGPADLTLRKAIQIMHGYQITHGFLSFLLDIIAKAKNRDGRYTFQQLEYYTAKGDPCIISVTQSLSPADGGHVLIPFFIQDLGATKKIFVYDPNRSYYEAGAAGRDYYHNFNNFIEINSGSGAWTFTMVGPETWSGSPSSGGNCIAVPLSVAGRKDRLPQSLLADGAYALNTIFIFADNATVTQISDPITRRRFLKADGSDIETHPRRRLSNVLPFIPFNGGKSLPETTQKVYFVKGNRQLNISIRAQGNYKIGMLFAGKYSEIQATGNGSVQHFLTPPKPKKKELNKRKKSPKHYRAF